MAVDDLARAEVFIQVALSGASCKSEAGLKLLGDIKLAYHAAGTGLAQGADESSAMHAAEGIFSRWSFCSGHHADPLACKKAHQDTCHQ